MLKKFAIQFIALTVIILAALAMGKSTNGPQIPFLPQQPKEKLVLINNTRINVEVADSADKRKKGLGGRDSLATDSGMLFIFEKEDKFPFWMKGLKFPLDFIWIRDLRVVDVIENARPPGPGQQDEALPIYLPRENIDMVLEVNAGFVAKNGIRIGDSVLLEEQ